MHGNATSALPLRLTHFFLSEWVSSAQIIFLVALGRCEFAPSVRKYYVPEGAEFAPSPVKRYIVSNKKVKVRKGRVSGKLSLPKKVSFFDMIP